MFSTSKKTIIVLLILVILAVFSAIFFFFFQARKTDKSLPPVAEKNLTANGGLTPEKELNGQVGNDGAGQIKQPSDAPVAVQPASEAQEAENLARFFVETLGSYSADANFENIFVLQAMMTEKMRLWSSDFVKRNESGLREGQERMITKVYQAESLGYSETRAVFLLRARREKEGAVGAAVYNQDAVATLVKEGGQWKVDAVEWR